METRYMVKKAEELEDFEPELYTSETRNEKHLKLILGNEVLLLAFLVFVG